jgi:non-heme chloroperoxidase
VQTAAKAYSTALEALTGKQEKSENGVRTANVITLPSADHHVFLSNEAEVLKDLDALSRYSAFAA